jgi:signal peptidase I
MTASDDEARARRNKRIIGLCIAWIGGGLFAAAAFARLFIFELYRQPSESMYPTIPSGSMVVADKRGFAHAIPFRLWKTKVTATPARGDIIAFYLGDTDTVYLKRVIGLPGDRVVVRGTQLIINDVEVPVTPGRQVGRYQRAVEVIDGREVSIAWMPERPSRDFDDTVPPGHYFTLGDNRDNSRDSRFPEVGFVSLDDIVGRVVEVLQIGPSHDPLQGP